MKRCAQCNQNFSDEVMFCPKCGRKLDAVMEEKHFCSKCGQQIEAGTKFCPKCGAPSESMTAQNLNTVNVSQRMADNSERVKNNDILQDIREKYLSFSGRLNRKPYIIRSLIVYVVMSVLLATVDVMFEDELSFDEFGMLTTTPGTAELIFTFIICIVGIVFMLSLNVRRLHDLNRTGWLVLLGCIPVANFALSIYVLFFKGTEGGNYYGPDPLQMK